MFLLIINLFWGQIAESDKKKKKARIFGNYRMNYLTGLDLYLEIV